MLIGVKRCVEQNDLRGLHYIFAEALEADPTFEKYQEDYEYCKKLPGFLEAYEELHPLKNDPSEWDETYWTQLKLDQKKNFSEKRMEHMKRVTLVVRKEKIERLQAERAKKAETIVSKVSKKSQETQLPQETVTAAPIPARISPSNQLNATMKVLPNPKEEAENRRIAEIKKQTQEVRNAHLASEKKEKMQWTQDGYASENQEDKDRKKAKGIALIVAILLVVIVVALFLLQSNPR